MRVTTFWLVTWGKNGRSSGLPERRMVCHNKGAVLSASPAATQRASAPSSG